MPTLWRHAKNFPRRNKGGRKGRNKATRRAYTVCSFPIWVDGKLDGGRHRKPVKALGGGVVRDRERAVRLVAALEEPNTPRLKPISNAIRARASRISPTSQQATWTLTGRRGLWHVLLHRRRSKHRGSSSPSALTGDGPPKRRPG